MPDTDYSTIAKLKPRVGKIENDASNTALQMALNAAAYVVDQITRQPPEGQIAFSETANTPRYFDDSLTGVVSIDDATDITMVKRGGVTLETAAYTLFPYNERPYVAIILDAGGSGPRNIQVNAKWGYCAPVDRPSVIEEATLTQAERFFERQGVNPEKLAEALQNPWKAVDPYVMVMLMPLMRDGELRKKARARLFQNAETPRPTG